MITFILEQGEWPIAKDAEPFSRRFNARHWQSFYDLGNVYVSCGEMKTMKRNVLLIPHLCLYSQKDFQQDVGHSSNLGQKQSGTPLTKKDQEENGIESLYWWWSKNSEKVDTQLSEQRVRCPEERSKAKEVENYLFTSVLMVIRLKLFFAQSVNQLSIYGAVSDLCEEYSICRTSTSRPVVAEKSDPFFAPANLLIMTPTSSIEIAAQENLLQKHKERVENLPQPEQLIKHLYWCRIPQNSWSRTVLHDKAHGRVLTIYRASDMSWVHVTTRWQINWP